MATKIAKLSEGHEAGSAPMLGEIAKLAPRHTQYVDFPELSSACPDFGIFRVPDSAEVRRPPRCRVPGAGG